MRTTIRRIILTSLLVATPALMFGPGASAQTLPTGFSSQLVAAGFSQPAGFTFLPDGRILITEQRTALIKVIANGVVATVGTVPNVNAGANERGLLGIDCDPGWPARPYIYVYYSKSSPNNMALSRFTVSGNLSSPNATNLSLGARYDILTDIPDNRGNHNGGTCRFGADNMLYVSIGDDAANPCDAQVTTDLRGVILRIDVSGLPSGAGGPPAKASIVPAGNPFNGPNDNARLTWVYGLRNPYRFNIDPVTGNLYVGDVGANSREEFNEVGVGGANLGWPWYEGTLRLGSCSGTLPTTQFPIAEYSHSGFGQLSIISFTRYRNVLGGQYNFGNAYEGHAFFAEYFQGFVRRIEKTGATWSTPAPVPGQPNATDWATGVRNVGDALVGPDGALYYVTQFPGAVNRLVFTPQLPGLTAPSTIAVGKTLVVRATRNQGDTILIALGAQTIPPTPLRGFFGTLGIAGAFPLKIANADAQGNVDFSLVVPAVAGITVHFQALAQAGPEGYLSAVRSTTVTP